MKESDLQKKLEKQGIDYAILKKEFKIKLKKGESLLNQVLVSIAKKLNHQKMDLMQVISPKNIIENHESKMINSRLKEELYESIKELSLLSWQTKKALIDESEDEMISLIKESSDYYIKTYKPIKKKMCEKMIDNWKKEETKNTNYIS